MGLRHPSRLATLKYYERKKTFLERCRIDFHNEFRQHYGLDVYTPDQVYYGLDKRRWLEIFFALIGIH